MMKTAAAIDPDVALIGGDIAYANGKHFFNWETLLRQWHQLMITPEGYTIPLVAAFGLALAACDQQPSSESGQATDPQSQQQSAVPSDSATASEEKTE